MDIMKITILPDGTIKTETDPISPANHQTAEGFLKGLTELAGGTVRRVAKPRAARAHGHGHVHEGGHGHGHSH